MGLAARLITTPSVARAPIAVFRAGFGFVFAGRLLMLEHRGRNSGAWHRVALEVVDREAGDSIVIASGFGPRTQWYRNLAADSRCVVSVGLIRRRRARAELLDAERGATLLADYAARHPTGWRELRRMISDVTGDPSSPIPLVRLRLESARSAQTTRPS